VVGEWPARRGARSRMADAKLSSAWPTRCLWAQSTAARRCGACGAHMAVRVKGKERGPRKTRAKSLLFEWERGREGDFVRLRKNR
jgi:hypothetical protein